MARRKRRRRNKIRAGAVFAAGLGGVLAVGVIVQVARDHPAPAAVVGAVVLAAVAVGAWLRWRALSRLMAYERDVAVTDHMSGPDFERWVARLLRDSGCRGVRVSGGAGDMGADITARTPHGQRLIVQCKRYRGNLSSPDVQRFAGTARDIHGADIALLVTTGRPTPQAREVARRCRIVIVDRASLGRWVATGAAPGALARSAR